MPEVSEIIRSQIDAGYLEAHGSLTFQKLGEKLKNKKTKKILAYFKTSFLQSPIEWSSVKDLVWEKDEEREQNRFSFLQGDIFQTKMVLGLGQSESNQQHDLWMVITPSCDLTQGNVHFRVAKVIRVEIADEQETSPGYADFQKLVFAAKCSSARYFPLPPLPNDGAEVLGYYVDLTTYYGLHVDHSGLAVVKHSLRFEAWHLLNIFLMQQGTRSNPNDEPKVRCLAENLSVPHLSRMQMRVYIGNEGNDFCVLSEKYSDADHTSQLGDGETFIGRWFQASKTQKAYWFLKQGLELDDIIKRDSIEISED